jgi:hypothetical protein
MEAFNNGRKGGRMGETVPANILHFKDVRRRESERLVAGWRELIARMQADGRNVTVAQEVLKTLEDELEGKKRKFGAA